MTESSLAALPSYLKAFEDIAIVEKKFKKLRRLAVDTRRLENEFATETAIYLDEWQLLLQHFLDPSEAETLLDNTHDSKWSSPSLSNGLRACLGSEYDSFVAIVRRIRDSITSLSESFLVDLNTISKAKGKGPATKNILDDLLEKSAYESSMDTFRETTQEFIRLRKAATEKTRHWQIHSNIKQPDSLPPSYQLATTYSKSLYEALRDFWTCLQTHHISHNVCLLIDSRHDGSLRVIVHYRTQSGRQVQSRLVDLIVCSRSIPLPPFVLQTSDIPPSRQDTEEERPAKVRKVRFEEDCTTSRTGSETTVAESSKDAAVSAAKDLCSGGNMCKQLCAHTKSEECGGYLDTPLNLRHTIQPVCGISCDHTQCLNRNDLGEPVPLDNIFNFRVDNTLLVPEQLRLALRLVKGVLQFHSTPWLRSQWQLQDLYYFEPSNILATSLETLHISSNLTKSSHDSLDIPRDQMAKAPDKAIRNITMYRLGVALLQIGQWVPLQPDDTAQVQHVIDLSTSCWPLGEQYHRITQKCLNCQFGFGNNLSEVDLQRAIYWEVVCGLEELIRKVDGRYIGED